MSKSEFHIKTASSPFEYQMRFEILSWIGRKFFSKKPKKMNGYCNLGCGPRFIPGYINADFFEFRKLRKLLGRHVYRHRYDWEVDLRYPMKCDDRFFEGVLLEHVLEHLTVFDAQTLLTELRRVVKKGGVVRISVPDLAKYVAFYVGADHHSKFDNWKEMPAEALWSLSHNFGHQSTYDAQLLCWIMTEAGFQGVKVSELNGSNDPMLRIDDVGRSWESLYVEGINP